MFRKLIKYFSFVPQPEPSDRGGLDLRELSAELQALIVKNRVKYLENESFIEQLQEFERQNVAELKELEVEVLRRCKLRKIQQIRKRIKRLSRVSTILSQNVDYQQMIVDKLENLRIAGSLVISADQLNEIALDYEEMFQQHNDHVRDAMMIMDESSVIEDLPEIEEA